MFPYLYVHKRFALRTKSDWIAYVIAFFGHDLMHYTAHRYGHCSNLGWAVHYVHHSAPDYNFTTGMRLGPDLLVVSSRVGFKCLEMDGEWKEAYDTCG